MTYRGDIRLGDTIDIKFTTVDSTGAPATLSGSPVGLGLRRQQGRPKSLPASRSRWTSIRALA
jgi:hypothetical protein